MAGRTPPPLTSWTVFRQIAALSAFAIAQPLVQLVKENPEFLTVHRSQPADLLILTGLLFLLLPAVLSAVVLAVGRITQRGGRWLHAGLLGLLLALTLLPPLDRLPAGGGAVTLGLGALAGIGFAMASLRSHGLRGLVSALSAVVPIFAFLFLGAGPIRQILFPARPEFSAAGDTTSHSVVMVILDEFPTPSLMRPDLELDCEMFPNFCRLAGRSTWYRNATSISGATLRSIPAILSGKLPKWRQTPTLENHPDNLFTLLGGSHRVWAQEVLTTLCPEELASTPVPALGDRLRLLSTDLGILYQHRVVPEIWRSRLIPIADSWGNFLGDETTSGGGIFNGPRRLDHFLEFVRSLQVDERPSLIVSHSLLPHSPFQFLPDGRFYNRGENIPSLPDETWRDDTEIIAHSYRRHLLQVAAVDRVLGVLLDRLEELGRFDDAAIVVTADHGISFKPGFPRRKFREGNEGDLMFVPLFLKLPGQHDGAVDDRFVQTIDILPTLSSALDIQPGWETVGLDLRNDPVDRKELLFLDQDQRERRHFGLEIVRERDAVVAWKHDLLGPGTGIERLFSGFDPGEILGRPLTDLSVRPHPTLRGRVLDLYQLEDVDPESSFIPAEINGLVEGHEGEERLSLALALDGTIVGASRSYLDPPRPGARSWQITVPPEVFHEGSHEVALFVVQQTGPEVELLQLPLTTPSFLGVDLGGTRIAGVEERGLFKTDDWDGLPVRWTDGRGSWAIPIKAAERPEALSIGIVSSGPAETRMEVTVNGRLLLRETLPPGNWETRLGLDGVEAGERLTVELTSGVFVPAEVNPASDDHRELGVAVRKLLVE